MAEAPLLIPASCYEFNFEEWVRTVADVRPESSIPTTVPGSEIGEDVDAPGGEPPPPFRPLGIRCFRLLPMLLRRACDF